MAVVSYPPNMPLYTDRILHRRVAESDWAAPISFIQIFILTLILFLGCLWGLNFLFKSHTAIGNIPPNIAFLIVALIPPIVILLVLLLGPRASSPVWPYQVAVFQKPTDMKLRWNLSVVATAFVYSGHIAQSEWLSQMPQLSAADRARALGYVRRVRNRLQVLPAFEARDIIATIIAGAVVFLFSRLVLDYNLLEAGFHGIALMIVLESLILYFVVQRWQHTRRLLELEEVFEELLPPLPPSTAEPVEDEVERWHRGQAEELEQVKKELDRAAKKERGDIVDAPSFNLWE
ncbi:MAG: hypothetical protein ACYDBB_26565 [Armatimonadota bacterium]